MEKQKRKPNNRASTDGAIVTLDGGIWLECASHALGRGGSKKSWSMEVRSGLANGDNGEVRRKARQAGLI